MRTKVKICGITKKEEIKSLIENKVDYVGIVLFYPKSKRNNTLENAQDLLDELKDVPIKSVAVTVSPTINQIKDIEKVGFDYIQIHGALSKEAFDAIELPIFRAFQATDLEKYEVYHNCSKIHGYVFDAAIPGSGSTFDWSILDQIPRDEKLFILAGGLNPENVEEAIKRVKPDVVDVSSGVEGVNGKDALKIKEFVERVNKIRKQNKKTK